MTQKVVEEDDFEDVGGHQVIIVPVRRVDTVNIARNHLDRPIEVRPILPEFPVVINYKHVHQHRAVKLLNIGCANDFGILGLHVEVKVPKLRVLAIIFHLSWSDAHLFVIFHAHFKSLFYIALYYVVDGSLDVH